MSFSHDRRGQSVVVGTVILFGFLILALSVYQVQFVPAENSEIEFEHSQQVEGDFQDLRNALLSGGTTGEARSTSIRLGTRYPQRTFFLNPPPASGTLETTDERNLSISNATVPKDAGAHENVRDFWENNTEWKDKDGPVFATKSIRYTPNYNEYRGAPELVYENSLVAAEFGDRALPRSSQTIIRDERVSLTTISGEISESGVEAQSVDSETISRGARTIPITGENGENVTISLPTALDNASDLVNRLDHDDFTADEDRINVTLDGGDTYRLALSEVSVDRRGETSPAYIVPVGSRDVMEGQSVGVEVRDKYNNPVQGADVVISDGDDRTTDDDGRVFYTPEPDESTASINGSVDPDKPDYESVRFNVSRGGEAGEANRTFDVQWDNSETNLTVGDDPQESGTVSSSGEPLDDANVDFSTTDPSVVETKEEGSTTTEEGDFSVDLNPRGVGNATVYAASGDDVSGIDVTVTDPPGTPSPPANFVATDVAEGENSQEFVFTVDGLGNNDQATIDLSDPQSDGVDYTNGDVELIERTNPNDAVSYDPSTNTITYTKRGGDPGEVRIRISNIDVTGNAGDTYLVEYADDDGNADSDTFEIRPSGTTIVTQDTDDVSANSNIVIEDNVVIDGDVNSQNGEVIIGKNADIDGDVNANGDIVIGDGTLVAGGVDSQNGRITVSDNAEIGDGVSANGNVVIGNDTVIDGDVDSQNGTVSLGSGTQVTGSVNANGNVDLGVGSLVEGDVTSQNGSVTLEDDSEVEGDVNVNSASNIVCGQGSRIDGQPCEEYVDENY